MYSFKKGDNDLTLRFDLTVPLAKYVAEYGSEITYPFRRYQIGKVYRGERAQRGRYREFYQCDIDVIGDGELNMVDAMCVAKAILGNPDASFDEKAADANLDGVIGMSDVMYIVNYVLNGKFPEEQGQ